MEQVEIDDFIIKEINNSVAELENDKKDCDDGVDVGRVLGLFPIFVLLLILFVRIVFVIYKSSGK